jgi:hypothetical protein
VSLVTLRDMAVVLIALEVFIALLVPSVALVFIVRGSFWVLAQMRKYAPVVQTPFRQAAEISDRVSHKVVAPVIAMDAFAAQVRRMRSVL